MDLYIFVSIKGANLGQQVIVDGLFEIVRATPQRSATATRRLIVMCRDGRLFGAHPDGSVYTGQLRTEPIHPLGRHALEGAYEILVKTPSPKDAQERPRAARVSVRGAIDPLARWQSARFFVDGRWVDVEITYLGPLPF